MGTETIMEHDRTWWSKRLHIIKAFTEGKEIVLEGCKPQDLILGNHPEDYIIQNPLQTDFSKIKEGDVLVSILNNGVIHDLSEQKIIGISSDKVFISKPGEFDKLSEHYTTKQQIMMNFGHYIRKEDYEGFKKEDNRVVTQHDIDRAIDYIKRSQATSEGLNFLLLRDLSTVIEILTGKKIDQEDLIVG